MGTEVRKLQKDEVLLSGSTLHWSERIGRRMPVTCGKCAEKRTINIPRGKKRQMMTGHCSSCRNGRIGEEVHPSGSIIYWGERDPANKQKVRIACHSCKSQDRFVWTVSARHPDWQGQCDDCNHERGRPKKYFKDELLPNGSIFHWTERDPNNFRLVPVTCGKCQRKRTVLIGARWRGTGLCHSCGNLKKLFQDEKVRDTGTIIHWGEPDPADSNRVMVTCGLCRIKRSLSKGSLLVHHKKPKWKGYCREHFTNPESLADLLTNKALSNEQMDGSSTTSLSIEKRRRGRKPGTKYIDPQASLGSLESAIKTLWALSRSISEITYRAIADVFHDNGEQIGPDAIRKRFNECNTGMKWRDFVVSVISQNGN